MTRNNILIVVLTFLTFDTFSQTILGSQIEYKGIDSFRFEIGLTVYVDCNDTVAFKLDSNNLFVQSLSGTIEVGLNPQYQFHESATNAHDSVAKCDTSNPFPGIRLYQFIDTIDFNTGRLLRLKKDPYVHVYFSTNRMKVGSNLSCSKATHRNGVNFARIYPTAWQGALEFRNPIAPMLYQCDQYIFTSFNANPNNKTDSISYSFAEPLIDKSTKCSYSVKHAGCLGTSVFSTNYGSGACWTNPNAYVGIYLDPQSGELWYKSTSCSEQANFVIEATRWRKDKNGKYKKSGVIRREQFHFTKSFQPNNNPYINGPYSYAVCEEEKLCFTITSTDKPQLVSGKPLPKDSTTLWWNGNIHEASFQIVNKKALNQSGRFCWTPPKGSASSLPYQFTVNVTDSSGPIQGRASRVFRISVKKKSAGQHQINPLVCDGRINAYETKVIIDSSFEGTPSYQRILLDSNGFTLWDKDKARFQSTGLFITTSKLDTLLIFENGKYIIKTTIENPPLRCPIVIYDTIQANKIRKIKIPTDSIYCDAINDTIWLDTFWSSVKWSDNSSMHYLPVDSAAEYSVRLTDSCGASVNLGFQLSVWENIGVSLPLEQRICDTIALVNPVYSGKIDSIRWSNGTNSENLEAKDTGKYTVRVFGKCNIASRTIHIHDQNPDPLIGDTILSCLQSPETLRHRLDSSWTVEWKNQKTTSVKRSFKIIPSAGIHSFKAWNNCKDTIAFAPHITHIDVPAMQLDTSKKLCAGDTLELDLQLGQHSNVLWFDGDIRPSKFFTEDGRYSVKSYNKCGQDSANFKLDFMELPIINLGDDSLHCIGDSVWVKAKGNFKDNWEWAYGKKGDSVLILQELQLWIKNSSRCGYASDTIWLRFDSKPEIIYSDEIKICKGGSFQSFPPNPDRIRYWLNDSSFYPWFVVQDSGWYRVKGENQCGSSIDSFYLVTQSELSVDLGPDLNLPIPFKHTLNSGVDADDYLWSTEDTTKQITVQDTGLYWVEVGNSCGYDRDSIFINKLLSVNEVNSGFISIFPNPSSGLIHVQNRTGQPIRIELINSKGQKVVSETFTNKLVLRDLETGVYYCNILSNTGSIWTEKIIVH